MNEPVVNRRRRRWTWGVLAGVLLFVGMPVAWRFRPLSAVERGLVGTWRSTWAGRTHVIALHPDRTRDASQRHVVALPDGTTRPDNRMAAAGDWTATADEICFTYPELPASPAWTEWAGDLVRNAFFRRKLRMSLEVVDEGRIRLEGIVFVRVPDDAPWSGEDPPPERSP